MCADIIAGKTACRIRTRAKGLARIRGGLGAAIVTFRTFKAMLNWAIERGLLEKNPATGVRLPKPPRRGRFLTREEAKRLLNTMDHLVAVRGLNETHADAIRLLIFTGARRTEILGLRWAEVDFSTQRLMLPPERSKTGGKTGDRIIALNDPALAVLLRRPRTGQYVFPAAKGDSGHFTGIQKSWRLILARCELGELRLHDLRHSFASFALEAGENILSISKALGHASTQMTEHYLHLRSNSSSALASRTAAFMLGDDESRSHVAGHEVATAALGGHPR